MLCRAAAGRVDAAEEQWMLRQAKPVRASYVRDVLDADGDAALLSQIWMLRQPKDIRESYLRDVLEPQR